MKLTNDRFPSAVLVEVNAHSLFSKWFSESGKLVQRLFSKITDLVDDPDTFVMVMIGWLWLIVVFDESVEILGK